MDGYVLLRYPLKKIETCRKIIIEIFINEWGEIYYFIWSIDLTTLLYHLHHGQNRVNLEFRNLIIIPENYCPLHKLRKCIHWKPANQKSKASRLLGQFGLRRLQTCLSDMNSIIIFFQPQSIFLLSPKKSNKNCLRWVRLALIRHRFDENKGSRNLEKPRKILSRSWKRCCGLEKNVFFLSFDCYPGQSNQNFVFVNNFGIKLKHL